MSVQQFESRVQARARLDNAISRIAERAAELDREPRFPGENIADLAGAGALDPETGGLTEEVRLVRQVAFADGSTARILDGHLNGAERLALNGPEPLRASELSQIAKNGLLLGVWGADPVAGEGPPARLEREHDGLVLRGVKTFCSGAGGVQRALIVACDEDGVRRLVYVDATSGLHIDREWYRASGLRSSESHRVEFHGTPILAVLGSAGELSREPWFSRDAIRTSATWAGLADRIVHEAIGATDPDRADPTQAHAIGRMRVAQATIDRWLEYATLTLERTQAWSPERGVPAQPGQERKDPTEAAIGCRVALYECALLISGLAARVCGSRALIGSSALDRARRDLDLFLLQHRLDKKITELGQRALRRTDR